MDTYEKKYNEALNWMRELYPGLHGATKEDAEHYFPELRESEDERIRKALINIVKGACSRYGIKYRVDEITEEMLLAYLEKQKEAKWSPSEGEMGVLYKLCYVSNQITDEDDTELTRLYQDLKREYFNGRSFENMFPSEKQKEQKPVEKQDYSGLTDLERAIYRGFLSAGVENVTATIIKETAKECLAQMKLAEWSYDNRIQYDSVKSGIEAFASTYSFNIESKLFPQLTKEQQQLWREEIEQAVIAGGENGIELARDNRYKENGTIEWNEEDEKTVDAAIYWLKKVLSLKEVDDILIDDCPISIRKTVDRLKSLHLQPKQKLSKKDKKILLSLHHVMNCADAQSVVKRDGLSVVDICNFLFSIEPSWKPSEEQMDALEKAIVRSCSHQYGVPLSELYEQLKKLM